MEVLSQGGELSKDKIVEELPNKLPGITAELVGNEILGEYKDYEFTIDENFEVTIGGKLTGNKPEVTLELITTQVSPKVQIKVKASVVDSTITELVAPSDITLVQQISETEKIYEVTKNATYYFTVKAENGRKAIGKITVSNVLEKPVLEEVENTGTTITVVIPNAIKVNGVTYTYYLNNVAKISNTPDSKVILEGATSNTSNTIYVVATINGQSLTSDPITVQTGVELKSPIIDLRADNLDPTPLDYPIITAAKGVVNCRAGVPNVGQEVTVKITNQNTQGDIYYSIDAGESWKKYTGEFKTNYVGEEKIQAKILVGKNASKIAKQKNDYVLDLSKNCTASDALDKAAYDGDPSTGVNPSSGKIRFYFAEDINIYQLCFVVDLNSPGTVFRSSNGGWAAWGEGRIYNGAWHGTYWGTNSYGWQGVLHYLSDVTVYEIYYDGTIPPGY